MIFLSSRNYIEKEKTLLAGDFNATYYDDSSPPAGLLVLITHGRLLCGSGYFARVMKVGHHGKDGAFARVRIVGLLGKGRPLAPVTASFG